MEELYKQYEIESEKLDKKMNSIKNSAIDTCNLLLNNNDKYSERFLKEIESELEFWEKLDP